MSSCACGIIPGKQVITLPDGTIHEDVCAIRELVYWVDKLTKRVEALELVVRELGGRI